MNASSRIASDPVDVFCEEDGPGDKLLRQKLLNGQPWASARSLQSQSELASQILDLIASHCPQYALRSPVTTDQLCNSVQGFGYLRLAAASFERVESHEGGGI